MLAGAVTVLAVRKLLLSLGCGGKGVTTDKPSVRGACVRDKVPVCCGLAGKQLVAGERRRGRGATSRYQLIAYASTSRAGRSHWAESSSRGRWACLLAAGVRLDCVR
jgi:hypothetical protein